MIASATIMEKNNGNGIIKCKNDIELGKIKDELSNKVLENYKINTLTAFVIVL